MTNDIRIAIDWEKKRRCWKTYQKHAYNRREYWQLRTIRILIRSRSNLAQISPRSRPNLASISLRSRSDLAQILMTEKTQESLVEHVSSIKRVEKWRKSKDAARKNLVENWETSIAQILFDRMTKTDRLVRVDSLAISNAFSTSRSHATTMQRIETHDQMNDIDEESTVDVNENKRAILSTKNNQYRISQQGTQDCYFEETSRTRRSRRLTFDIANSHTRAIESYVYCFAWDVIFVRALLCAFSTNYNTNEAKFAWYKHLYFAKKEYHILIRFESNLSKIVWCVMFNLRSYKHRYLTLQFI